MLVKSIFGGIALFQTIQGKRYPGDFQFDPLGLSQVQTSGVCVCREWRGVEKKEGWAVDCYALQVVPQFACRCPVK